MEKNRPLGWTTLEEAKKLVAAGLDPNTADMYYFEWKRNTSLIRYPKCGTYTKDRDLPCWSLGTLIELMPKSIVVDDAEYWFNTYVYSGNKYCINYYYRDYDVDDTILDCIGKNLICAAVDMITFLIEDGYIKKSE